MFILLHDRQERETAINMNNIVQIQEFGEGQDRYTALWSNTSNGDGVLYYQVGERLARIMELVNDERRA